MQTHHLPTHLSVPPPNRDREGSKPSRVGPPPSESGQATAEYGLVLLAAASLAGALLAWATSSGGVSRLMNAVMDTLIGGIGGP